MTYQIALVDDETAELDKTEKLLRIYEEKHTNLDFMVERFERAETLLYMVREKGYEPDMIFMDIFMPGEKGTTDSVGMEAAKDLRDIGNCSKLFFLTTSREYALDAFDVDASSYLLKPVLQDKLFSVLDKFVKEDEEEGKRYLLFRIEGRLMRISVNDIMCCEAQGKTQCLYLSDGGTCMVWMTMAEIYGRLSCYREFVKVGVSFIVNLEFIESLNARELYLNTGKKVYLPRGTYKTIREIYFQYYCGDV